MSGFFAMGGFAWYVWPCYALTGLCMIWVVVASWRARAANRTTLAALTSADTRDK